MKLFHITSFFAKIALVLRICTKKMQRVLKAALEKCKFGQKMHCYGARLLSAFTALTIKENVTYIDWYAFYGCSALKNIRCEATNPPYLSSYALTSFYPSSCTLTVPQEAVEAYRSSSRWSEFGETVGH